MISVDELEQGRISLDQVDMDQFDMKGLNLPLHIYPRLEPSDTLLGLVAVMFTSLVASIWPAWIAARLEPMEAMRA